MSEQRVAVVTGGNRGMGFALCRELASKGYRVLLCSRNPDKGEAAAQELRDQSLDVLPVHLDVTNSAQISALTEICRNRLGRVDALINNAGILVDNLSEPVSILDANPESISASFEINTLAPVMVSNALIPLMRERNYGRIVNVSSGMGQLQNMGGCHAGYRISKTALNSATCIYAAELDTTNIKVNAVCPGWVRTEMGGGDAERSVEEGIDTTLWLATLPDDGPSGGYFRDRERIDW